jgi:hypothetical protein
MLEYQESQRTTKTCEDKRSYTPTNEVQCDSILKHAMTKKLDKEEQDL